MPQLAQRALRRRSRRKRLDAGQRPVDQRTSPVEHARPRRASPAQVALTVLLVPWLRPRQSAAGRTAALDAETEHALFERYAAAARDSTDGRITVLVSHRFSTVRMADLIVMLDGARLVEVGTHDDLLAHNGQYAELYRIQAAAYN